MKKLLAIDDQPAVLRCLQKALKTQGYELLVTNDPDEGLDMLRKDNDIILAMLDVKMPRKSGFEIYQELRQFRDIPVLFATAYTKSFDTRSDAIAKLWSEQFADGTTDIIYKPFSLAQLFDKVEGLIGPAPRNEG
jgi:CheY-like chemotaxis protein